MKVDRTHRISAGSAAFVAATGVALGEIHVLQHGALRVEIEIETSRHIEEFGPRFDRTAVVRSIAVDGIEHLGTWGLSDEFGLYGNGVLGYEAASQGEPFVKIGVGALLRDTTDGYHFARRYPVQALFPIRLDTGERHVTVSQDSGPAHPQRYHYRKTYSVSEGNALTIHYRLENTGEDAWTFEHYNHHWFRLDGVTVGPPYLVTTGFELTEKETKFLRTPTSLQLPAPLEPGAAAYYASELAGAKASANTFELSVDGTALLRYTGSFSPARFALFASSEGFCPEVFKRAALQPGRTATWSATYRFAGPAQTLQGGAGASPR
jgi:hypothetical protein